MKTFDNEGLFIKALSQVYEVQEIKGKKLHSLLDIKKEIRG
jgi:hypothetical protein